MSSRIELSQPPQAGQILRPLRHPASADDVVQQVNLEELPRENQVACDFEVRFARGRVLRPFLAVQLPDCNQMGLTRFDRHLVERKRMGCY